MAKVCSIGGQAVMEGVMMKSPTGVAMAVRRADGTIATSYDNWTTRAKKGTFLGLPIIRGVVTFIESLSTGMTTLTESAKLAGEDIDEEPTRFEKWLSEKLGKSVESVVVGIAVLLAVVLSVGLFFLLPLGISSLRRACGRGGRVEEPDGGAYKAYNIHRLHNALRKHKGCQKDVYVSWRGA